MKMTKIPDDFTDFGGLPKGLAFTWVGYQRLADQVRDTLGIAYSSEEIKSIIQGNKQQPEVVQIAKEYLRELKAGMNHGDRDLYRHRLNEPWNRQEGLF